MASPHHTTRILSQPTRPPRMSRHSLICAFAVIAMFGTWFDVPAGAQQAKTANDRVYSEAQAKRGEAVYGQQCVSCHGQALRGDSGPPLTGDGFITQWGSQALSDLVNKIQRTMPASDPGKLTRQQSTDLVAYVLQMGKFPAGQADLTDSDALLKAITIPGVASARLQPAAPAPGRAPSFPPAGNLAQVMRGILFPSSNLIFNVQGQDPSEVKATGKPAGGGGGGFSWVDWGAGIYPAWELVDYAAVALAESAPMMLTPGRRCENGKPVPVDDANWIKFTQELADAGVAAYKASQTRNQEVVSDITNQIADSCLHCHQVYRDHPGPRRGDPPNRALRCTPR
jgi:mono/diheme cytochrome c family protein